MTSTNGHIIARVQQSLSSQSPQNTDNSLQSPPPGHPASCRHNDKRFVPASALRVDRAFRDVMYISAWTVVRAIVVAYVLFTLARFLHGDADLSLMRKDHPPPHHFEDKVVWITGASQGLGEVLAKYFAAQGARLVISARRAVELEVSAPRIPQGCGCLPVCCHRRSSLSA